MLFFVIFNSINFKRHRIFKHKLTKIARITQDFSFTLLMIFIGALYFE